MRSTGPVLVAFILAGVSCGGTEASSSQDTGPGTLDGSVSDDAGARDGGPPSDTGPRPDAGPPGTCPTGRFAETDVHYLGAFTVPAAGEGTFSYGGAAIAFNPTGNGGQGTLIASGHVYEPTDVAVIDLPAPVITRDPDALPEANILLPFADVTGGLVSSVPNPRMEGMLWTPRGTLFNLFMYYNVNNTDGAYLGLSPERSGLYWIGDLNMQRTGYLAEIPASCRALFGGYSYAVGSVNKAGEATTSPGPHFTAFDLPDPAPAADAHLPAMTAMDFTLDHRFSFRVPGADDPALGTTSGPHEWNNSDFAKGMAFVVDADRASVVYVTLLSTQSPHYAYGDPPDYPNSCASARGVHHWGMHAMLLFFEPADLARAARGEIERWAPAPYLSVDVSSRFFDDSPNRCITLGGVTFDSAQRRLFVVEQYWTGSDSVPIIHLFRIGA